MTAQTKNIQALLNDYIKDAAILIAHRTDKETELECLEKGREMYAAQKNFAKVLYYNRAIEKVNTQIEDYNELINPRLLDIRRAKETLENLQKPIIV